MGCGLNKLEKHDEKRPGNIYSTLKRPQVETKIDICYEYRFLDFTTLNDTELPGSSAIKLSSLHDLPLQLQELYQQGFILAAVHPFVQPTDEKERTPQEQIFRAVLIKKTERSLKNDVCSEGYMLDIECCSFSDQLSDKNKIPDFIKKIHDAASLGLKFVGVIPQYHSQKNTVMPTGNNSVQVRNVKNASGYPEDHASLDNEKTDGINGCKTPTPNEGNIDQCAESSDSQEGEGQVTEHLSLNSAGENGEQLQQENLSISLRLTETTDEKEGATESDASAICAEPLTGTTEFFVLFNKPKTQQRCSQYYTVTIPMRISRNGQTVNSLEANWLEHMSDHFRKGGSLVNAMFNIGMVNDSLQGLIDGVFIFEDLAIKDSKTIQPYDAIVVEQWTVLEGMEVKTDYIPLLNSLAAYGWQLTCVLPTPIVKTNREGNLATKQIVFLQRPSLPQKAKKKESKFHWRFSKEEMSNKQSKRAMKAKLSARDKPAAEERQESTVTENIRNLETPLSATENIDNSKTISDQQLDDITDTDMGVEILGDRDIYIHSSGESEEKWPKNCDTHQNELEACLSQEGMSDHCGDHVTHEESCALTTDTWDGGDGGGSMDLCGD
ncbi:PREDICTED: raftlin [Gavialis gangeticus]|uniref:raftlin n=1 Tax=Gavialis gangeticus TaxID=94835 RepID=UPI00092FCC62|nr:PREDICTED: raftlin [Gavialis gangeticus]XP_019364216.1 PREDICTED: raftlin [Gavialis gangeticus]XP_019364217.1 PREDICTED: raftlin [Gavialis gangeticus]XP_019364218.1 PREDICTED: raftlin [Gavialis gangeticus]